MVFQEPLLFDTTVFENVAAGLKIRGMGRTEIERTVPEYLERFGIGHLAKRSARKLSGGEAQRTSLARAFVTKPEIVFLDEPFSALDPPTREALTGDLERILRETHTTAVASTHDQTEALRLGDRLAVMQRGEDRPDRPGGRGDEPAGGRIRRLLRGGGDGPAGTGRADLRRGLHGCCGRGRDRGGGSCPDGRGGALLHPAGTCDPLHERPAARRPSARNVFPGTIRTITPLGLFHRVRLDCGFDLVAYVTRQSLEELAWRREREVTASFKATAVHVIPRSEPPQI